MKIVTYIPLYSWVWVCVTLTPERWGRQMGESGVRVLAYGFSWLMQRSCRKLSQKVAVHMSIRGHCSSRGFTNQSNFCIIGRGPTIKILQHGYCLYNTSRTNFGIVAELPWLDPSKYLVTTTRVQLFVLYLVRAAGCYTNTSSKSTGQQTGSGIQKREKVDWPLNKLLLPLWFPASSSTRTRTSPNPGSHLVPSGAALQTQLKSTFWSKRSFSLRK